MWKCKKGHISKANQSFRDSLLNLGSLFCGSWHRMICLEWSNWNCLNWPYYNRFYCVLPMFIRCSYFWQAVSNIISSVKAENWVNDSFCRQHSSFSCSALQTEHYLLRDFLSSNKSDSNHTTIHKENNNS